MMTTQWMRRWIGGAILVVMLTVLRTAAAQTEAPSSGLTLAELQIRLKYAQGETELEPNLKQDVIEVYQAAIERFEIADEATAAAKTFQQRIDAVSEDLRQVTSKAEMLPEQSTFAVRPEDDIETLERKLKERRNQIDEPDHGLRARVDAIKKELTARKSRLEEITRDLAEIDERLVTIQELMDSPASEGEPRELTVARHALFQTRQMRAIAERAALWSERAWCESGDVTELMRAQRDLAARELALAEAEAQQLQDAVDQRRGGEAAQRVRAAEQVMRSTSPQARPVAEKNLLLATESRDVTVALRETNQRVDSTRVSLNLLKAEFDQSKAMVDAVGLTESIGQLLRQQRTKLSKTRALYAALARRGETVQQVRMRAFRLEAEIAALQDLDAASLSTAQELTSDEAATETAAAKSRPLNLQAVQQLADEVRPLLQQRLEMLEGLNSDYESQFKKLVLLDNDERKLLEATRQYAAYIDERVLWIRTGTVFQGSHAALAVADLAWLGDQTHWLKVVDALRINFERTPLPYIIALGTLLIWIGLRWGLRRRLRMLGSSAATDSCQVFFPTVQAVVVTVLLALVIPSVLGFVGWRLDHCASPSRFVHAVAVGLLCAARFAVPLELLRLIVQRGGLAEQHFDWSPDTVLRLRRHLYWFLPTGIVLIGLVGMVEATSDEQRIDSLGRLCYLVFSGLLALFCFVAFPRTSPAMQPIASIPLRSVQDDRRGNESPNEDDVWMNRLARLGTFLAMTIPLGLLVLSWSGYFYTALQLTWRLQASIWLVMGLVLLRGTIQRWITLERRRMALLQAEEMQTIAGAGKHPDSAGHSPFLFPRWTWPDFRMNLTQIVTQVRSLLDTGLLTLAAIGLWFVWADVTPALHILDRVTLWQTTVQELVETTGSDEKPVVQVVQRPMAITAANLGLALLMISIAMVAGRNVPGLVEVILLEHLSVDAGIRFATTCLVRYAIFITGVVLAFNQIGVGWNSVQWLVAAASVGLGFGLQEIFANFVSGIILLFERPMRVGDVVTVGSTTGTVSRIRFRATTIVDGDRKELIVPNKSFITGNLLNWTLSDNINRVAIKVGVAYGSDPHRVRDLLLKIASEHPSLLKEPAPSASLEELGDSALIFQLRAFLPNLGERQKATHELNAMIHDRFRDAGIEIPFPQQEVSVNIRDRESSGRIKTTDSYFEVDARSA